MNKLLFIISLFISSICNAQSDEKFEEFRNNVLTNYQGFRKGILDDYVEFLQQAWEGYKSCLADVRSTVPKPLVTPVYDNSNLNPVELPKPDVNKTTENHVPKKDVCPIIPSSSQAKVTFGFYGFPFKVSSIEYFQVKSTSHGEIARTWKKYKDSGAKQVADELSIIAKAYNFNDWLTLDLVRCYVDDVLKYYSAESRILLRHFLLVCLGYDVRIAQAENTLALLIPFNQNVYAVSSVELDGRKYIIYFDARSNVTAQTFDIYTCKLPNGANFGNKVGLIIPPDIKLSSKSIKTCKLTDGIITCECSIDQGVMEAFRHYPQTDTPIYAKSCINKELQTSLLKQIKPYLAGLSQRDAANRLLHFVQYAFQYATDQTQHGYEKFYFIEENLFYPKNDCEDRSIFFAFLVRNLLWLDVHLIQYPGHECTAIHFTDNDINGDSYIYQGKRYIICDPTYIGAKIGQCMERYKKEKPKIEF